MNKKSFLLGFTLAVLLVCAVAASLSDAPEVGRYRISRRRGGHVHRRYHDGCRKLGLHARGKRYQVPKAIGYPVQPDDGYNLEVVSTAASSFYRPWPSGVER